ncbi:MAG: YciI family protein [Haliscomenobacter sp.]|uniref:YciI family protein n=1 Tax=Haliscomenobacter sp. TaxID=2717303 RepID=UPI0029ACC45F|nr:YciI family protein [Haliscomenobacter sp.]MDX2067178.1 YciI family protein [Haliscomenobacter sp.]
MSKLYLYFLGLSVFIAACKPGDAPSEPKKSYYAQITEDTSYDSLLAQKLDADDYGMKAYVMAFLKTGPNRKLDSAATAKLQEAHLKNIFRMADEGKLLVAGPFMDDTDIRGIYIFDVRSVEEAKKLTETDPAIKAGSLVMELHPWYGSAALPLLAPLHKKVQKNAIVD